MTLSQINTSDFSDKTEKNEISIIDQLNEEEVIRLIPVLIYFFLIVLIGLIGNGLVCYIYRPQTHTTTARWFVFVLGVIDCFCCGLIVPFEIVATFYQYNFDNDFLCKLSALLNTWSTLALALTLVFISIDRYRKVCKHTGRQISLKIGRILSGVALLVCFLAAIPGFAARGIYNRQMDKYNITASVCTFRSSGTSSYKFWYIVCGSGLFVVSLVTICIMYCLIGLKVLQHMRRKKMFGQAKTAAMMLGNKRDPDGINQSMQPQQSTKEPAVIIEFPSPNESAASNMTDEQPLDEIQGAEIRVSPTQKQSNKLERTKSYIERSASARKATISIFLISLAFVASYFPNLCLLILRSSQKNYEEELSNAHRAVYKFFLRFYYLNCVINPFIYGISDSFFKIRCKAIFNTLFGICSKKI